MNVSPSTAFEAVVDLGATGLTPGVRILDNAGATTTARTTAGIAEYPSGSGVYYASLTAPSTQGQYEILWDNGSTTPGNVAAEDLLVTVNAVTQTPSPIAGVSQPFVCFAQGFGTGLLGTIGVRVVDNAGGTSVNRATTGISEAPSGSGCYLARITAPSVLGQYAIVWDDGSNYAVESLTVGTVTNAVVATAVSSGSLTASPASAGSVTATPGSAGSTSLTPVTVGTLTLS